MEEKSDYIWTVEEEKLKEEQEKIMLEKRDKLAKKKELRLKKRRKKQKKLFAILVFIFMILFFIFSPLFQVNKVTVKNNNYFPSEDIVSEAKKYVLKDRFSIFEYFTVDNKIGNNKYYERIKFDYAMDTNSLNIWVDEVKPIYHDNNHTYFLDNKKNIVTGDKNFSTPYIDNTDLSSSEVNDIVLQIDQLKQDLFLQIKSIKRKSSDTDSLELEMYDGNTLYILINQIYDKLKYYNQMKDILDENEKGPGNIYLDIGDYYEPKD